MALASQVARLREVLLQGPSQANTRIFAANNATITLPAGADGVVIFPEGETMSGTLTLRGSISDTGLAINTFAPTIICTTDPAVFLFCLGGGRFSTRYFRLQ
jgi:hypothetical protein